MPGLKPPALAGKLSASFFLFVWYAIISVSKIVQYLKGRSSRFLQEEYSQLKKRYWGQHLWGRGYFCVTVGSMTEEMIKEYIERHAEDEDKTLTVHDEFQS